MKKRISLPPEKIKFDLKQNDRPLSDIQKQEIVKRDDDFINGRTTARDWSDIKKDLNDLYR